MVLFYLLQNAKRLKNTYEIAKIFRTHLFVFANFMKNDDRNIFLEYFDRR